MFRKFHEKLKDHEEGFTLIELLVVILIIAILAAIAIPVFLNQRNKGYVSQAESALKNAATNMEAFATSNNGTYPAVGDDTALVSEGFRRVSGVTIAVATSSSSGYCLHAAHDKIGAATGTDYVYDSNVGKPVAGATC
jgi:type IV pilus assembly protein PilA